MKMSKAGRPRLELRLRYSIEWGVRMYSMYIGYLHTLLTLLLYALVLTVQYIC